jgi:hypothetical protein
MRSRSEGVGALLAGATEIDLAGIVCSPRPAIPRAVIRFATGRRLILDTSSYLPLSAGCGADQRSLTVAAAAASQAEVGATAWMGG